MEDLIDPIQYQWRVDLVRATFLAPDAELILQIPLRRSIGDDWLAWTHEKSGIYSVRSAYRALLEIKDRGEATKSGEVGSSNMRKDEKWKRLWKLDVLPRVRSFWWRVLRGILPVYATLTRRHVKVNSTCPVCKSASENMIHAMIECGHAKQF